MKNFIKNNHSGTASLLEHFSSEENISEENIKIVSSEVFKDLKNDHLTDPIICKIDVEGKEMDVIESLVESEILKSITEIFYEVDIRWQNPQDLEAILKENGFRIFQKVRRSFIHYDVLATR